MEQIPMGAKKIVEMSEWRVHGEDNQGIAGSMCRGPLLLTQEIVTLQKFVCSVFRSPNFYVHDIDFCMLAKIKKRTTT